MTCQQTQMHDYWEWGQTILVSELKNVYLMLLYFYLFYNFIIIFRGGLNSIYRPANQLVLKINLVIILSAIMQGSIKYLKELY